MMPRHVVPRLTLACAVFALAPVVASQPPTENLPQFEVASIKLNKAGDNRVMIGVQPGGRFTATNVPLRLLIRNAYQLQDFQIVGGPGWITAERYDILAKAESDGVGDPFQAERTGEPSRGQLMLRALLKERFTREAHFEDRDTPIYALVPARSDGKLGPQLKKSETDCDAIRAAGRGRGPGAPPPPGGLGDPGTPMRCGIRVGPGNMAVGGSSMAQVANSLAMFAGRIVVDKTDMTGNYDFTLTWTPEQLAQRPPGAPEPLVNGVPIDPNGPSLFTAVQEQLGLKLESQRGPVKVLVIDRVEHPTEN